MSHALIWSEINPNDLSSELKKEIRVAGLGTNVAGTWTKKVFQLKWINSSVSDVKLWLDNSFAEIYENNSNFPTYNNNDLFDLQSDLNFEFRAIRLNNYNVNYLPYADAAINTYFYSELPGTDIHVNVYKHTDGQEIALGSRVLLLNQSTTSGYAKENGLYKVVGDIIANSYRLYRQYEVMTAGRQVSVGNSSYFHWFEGLKPGETYSQFSPTTIVKWVDKTNVYELDAVDTATTENLFASGSGLTLSSKMLDNYTLSLNDRVLVKDQTDAKENGIYYVSSLNETDKNTLINPNTSTNSLDNYWDEAIYNILQDIPVSVRVGHGTATYGYGGKYYRYYNSSDSQVTAFLANEFKGNDSITSIFGSTLSKQWVDATHYYNDTISIDWYYAVGATEGYYDNQSLFNMPTNITDFNGNSVLTQQNEFVLVNHSFKPYSGIYQIASVGNGNTSEWTRAVFMNTAAEVRPFKINVSNSRTSIGSSPSPWFYLARELSYKQATGDNTNIPGSNPTGNNQWILDQDNIIVSERYIPWRYKEVTNIITSEISNFNRVNTKQFNKSGVGLTERVLVTGQATTESQNGIYSTELSSFGTTLGLEFFNTYNIKNGTLFQDLSGSASGQTYFLYASEDLVSAGTTTVKFVNFTEPSWFTPDSSTTYDRFTSGRYITPDDFSNPVNEGDLVFVNNSNKKISGLYDATLGTPEKPIFNYSDNYVEWIADIYRNILSNKTETQYILSTNLKKQTEGILLVRNSGGYGDTDFTNSLFGNIYVPEIKLTNSDESEKYFSEEYKGSALTQELEVDWYEQDYQKFNVSAVYNTNTLSGFPLSSGTAISNNLSNGNSILEYADVLVYIGNGISSESNYNGIYRAIYTNNGIDVYFTKHEEFDKSTELDPNSNIKINGTPYERPSKVNILNGYFTSGSSFGYSTVYMQGVLSHNPYIANFGSTSTDSLDDTQYHAGIDFYIRNSNVRLSADYNGLMKFPKISPINHFIIGDLKNRDTVDGDILIVNRGYELYTLSSNSFTKFYYEIGDRVIYQDDVEENLNSDKFPTVNGIYVISHIDRESWSYYLRKIKQNSSLGHIDFPKRLTIHSNSSLLDSAFNVVLYGGTGDTYYWSEKNFNYSEVYIVGVDGKTYNFSQDSDYEIYPEIGWLANYTSWPISGDFYCYLYQNNTIPSYNEVSKSLKNRFYIVDQVIEDKYALNSGLAISSSQININKTYLQLSYNSGNATTTDQKYNSDRIHWYIENNDNKNYLTSVKNVVEIGSTTAYFVTSRQFIDGYFNSSEKVFDSNFYDTNLIDPGTGISQALYEGTFYFEKINQSGSGLSVENWYDDLSLTSNDNILILSNNNSSIAQSYQTYYYNDNNLLVKHLKSGKNDQKLIKYDSMGYTPVTLTYNANFGSTFKPTAVDLGNIYYFLHYDPDNNLRDVNDRTWFDLDGVDKFEYDYETTTNISDLNDLHGDIDGITPSIGNTVLVKNQTNTRFNGLYTVVENDLFKLQRTFDLRVNGQVCALGRVQYGTDDYELILPPTTPYTIGSTAGNTPLVWKKVGYGQTIDVEVASNSNWNLSDIFDGSAYFPDTIDEKTLFENDKILLLGQTDNTERIIARYAKNIRPTLSRVVAAGSTNTAGFSITSCFVNDNNRNIPYEIYFSGASVAVGATDVYWVEQGFIEDYDSPDFEFNTVTNLTALNIPSSTPLKSKILVKAQSGLATSENGIYIYDRDNIFRCIRDKSLDEQSEFTLDKRVKVLGGKSYPGTYALIYDEDNPFVLDTSDLNWFEVPENYNLDDCRVATTENIDLNSPPSIIDNINLISHDRILVKDQTDKTENGVYVVKDLSNSIWNRSEDLNSNDNIYPQTTVKISEGENNSGKIYRIKLPFGHVGYDYQYYEIDVDNIEWVEVDGNLNYYESPDNWQEIGTGSTTAFYLGKAKMDIYGKSQSDKFAIAIKSPTSSKFSGNGITQNGKIRNLKFKVEYNTIDD